MSLLDGVHPVATLTSDLDRLISFYEPVFDAPVTLNLSEVGLRHAFIQLGPNTVLHPFQVPGIELPQQALPMFRRGRIDHVALLATSEEAFRELRGRVVTEGAGDGVVTHLGSSLIFTITDPDGANLEVVWPKPGVPVDASLPRSEWQTATMD